MDNDLSKSSDHFTEEEIISKRMIKARMNNLIISFIILVVSTSNLYSQNKIIQGRVISDDFEIVKLVSTIINDTVEVGKTDLKGFFQIGGI